MADPTRANEIMMSVGAADALGLHVGQTVTWGTYTDAQFGSAANTPPPLHQRLTLVGTVVLNNAVVQDEIDANGPGAVIFTPALTRRLENCCSNYTFTYLRLDHGGRDVPAVEAELQRVIPSKLPRDYYDSSIDVTKAQNAIKPEAIALAVFDLIAGLAAILIAGQVIGRQLAFWAPEERTLRALGANPSMTVANALLGIMGAVVVGALVALAVAVALSPLAPLGPVRPLSRPGVALNWTVLGLGVAVLVMVLGSVGIVLAVQRAPQHAGTRRRPRAPSRIDGAASVGGLPVSAVTGIRFALEPGAESGAVPVRTAILGAVLAVVVIIATLVFGASLNSLASHPRLYGWNWNDALTAGGGVGDIPAARSATLLDHDPNVVAWSGYWYGNLQIDGLTVPVLGGSPDATVAPAILTGHGFDGPGQIVLGPGTLAQLHKSVGDSVTVRYGTTTPHLLRIVGTATMPAVGVGGVTGHASMGTGAVVPYQLLPASVRNQYSVSPAGPNVDFVRLKPDANARTASGR